MGVIIPIHIWNPPFPNAGCIFKVEFRGWTCALNKAKSKKTLKQKKESFN